jgi:hypothetical protein
VLNLLQAAQDGLPGKVIELLAAQIIVAALHVTHVQPAGAVWEQRLFEKRDILVEELLLQILCAGRNNHALARTNYGDEIRQSLPGSGASLDDEVTFFFEGLLYRLRHLELAAAKFIRGMGARQHAAGGEELVKRDVVFLGGGDDWRCGLRDRSHRVSIISHWTAEGGDVASNFLQSPTQFV